MIRGILAAVGSVLLATVAAAADRPNIVLILADDLGYGDLGCFGNTVIRTPHLDALAKQGVRLTQCYSASAVCSPSRSAILTGRTPHRNGVYTWLAEGSPVHLRKTETTFPTLLTAAGYATAHIGKWHLNGKFNDPAQPQPGDHGYGFWMATQNNAGPSHKNPTNFVRNGKPVGPLTGYSADLVATEAVTWLTTGRDKAKPFFLAVWTHEPHLPIESDPVHQSHYDAVADADVRQHHGNVTQLDDAVGKVLAALEALKLADSTLVIFTADNGPEGDGTKNRTRGSTGGLRGRKRALYEGGIRVPGIVRWPGKVKPGITLDGPVIGSDLFPTVLSAVGVPVPVGKTIDGANLVPTLTGSAAAPVRSQPLYWRLNMAPNNLHIALRDGDWKLLAAPDFSKYELYDLKRDPRETTDRMAAEPARFDRMAKMLRDHTAAVEAEGPDWWKTYSPNGATLPKKK